MIHKDKLGKTLQVGDKVVIGYDNGSSLIIGRIVKLTPKRVWLKTKPHDDGMYCRSHDRVVKLKG